MNQEPEKIYHQLMSKYDFHEKQKKQIIIGIEKQLNVIIYAKSEFD